MALDCRQVDRIRDVRVEQPQAGVHLGGDGLDEAEGADECAGESDAAYREVLDGPLGLRPVERVLRDLYVAEGIFFYPKFGHKAVVEQSGVERQSTDKSNYTHSLSFLHSEFTSGTCWLKL